MDILQYIKAIIISIGCIAGIIIMLIKFGGEKIAELISKRYELKLEEQLSDYNHQQEIEIQKLQTRLEEKIYVSRNRFDKEFNFIEEFLSKYFEFASLLWNVYITKESPEYTEAFEKLWDASEEFIKFYYMHKVLLNNNLSEKYGACVEEIHKFCTIARYARKKYEAYDKVGIFDDDGNILSAYQSECTCNYDKMRDIHDEINRGNELGYDHMVDISREYLDSLQVV